MAYSLYIDSKGVAILDNFLKLRKSKEYESATTNYLRAALLTINNNNFCHNDLVEALLKKLKAKFSFEFSNTFTLNMKTGEELIFYPLKELSKIVSNFLEGLCTKQGKKLYKTDKRGQQNVFSWSKDAAQETKTEFLKIKDEEIDYLESALPDISNIKLTSKRKTEQSDTGSSTKKLRTTDKSTETTKQEQIITLVHNEFKEHPEATLILLKQLLDDLSTKHTAAKTPSTSSEHSSIDKNVNSGSITNTILSDTETEEDIKENSVSNEQTPNKSSTTPSSTYFFATSQTPTTSAQQHIVAIPNNDKREVHTKLTA